MILYFTLNQIKCTIVNENTPGVMEVTVRTVAEGKTSRHVRLKM